MDSSRAWLTVVADNNDEGDDDYNKDEEGLRADRWLSPRAHPAARETFKYSWKKTKKTNKKKTDKEWKLKCLEICQGGMWCKHFYKLEAQFPCGCFFFHVFILILLSLLWCIFGFLEGEDRGLKSWKIGWVEPYVNLGCTLWLFTFKLKVILRSMISRKINIK